MHLIPKQLFLGVAPELIIDCARQIHERDRPFSLHDFCRALGAPIREATPVLDALVESDFVLVQGERFVATQKFGQLALAKVSVGISREQATLLISQIVAKAAHVNSQSSNDDDYRVECIVVFGSYLTTKEHLGDLDVGVQLSGGRKPHGENIYAWLARSEAARNRTLRALRLRQPKIISLHDMDEVLRLRTPYEVIFGALSSPRRDHSGN